MSLRYHFILVIGLLFGAVFIGDGCKWKSSSPPFPPTLFLNSRESSYYSLLEDGNFRRCYDYLYPPIQKIVTRDQYADYCKDAYEDIIWPANSLRTDDFQGPLLEGRYATTFIVCRLTSREVASKGGHPVEFGSNDIWIDDGTNLWVAPLEFFDLKLKMMPSDDLLNYVTNRVTVSDLFHKE
jgi:hypothetical protein